MTFASPSVLPAAGALTKERVMALVTRPSPLVRTGTDTGRPSTSSVPSWMRSRRAKGSLLPCSRGNSRPACWLSLVYC
jgi:hypothetical protein